MQEIGTITNSRNVEEGGSMPRGGARLRSSSDQALMTFLSIVSYSPIGVSASVEYPIISCRLL